MAKLIYSYGTMNAGKTAQLLQTEFNYRERGLHCLLLTAALDTRYGAAKITSRIGLSADAETFSPDDDLMSRFFRSAAARGTAAVLIDEAQFLTRAQVFQLGQAVDLLDLPVMAFGIRTDFKGELFEGTSALMAIADELREMRTICHCGKRATMVLRKNEAGFPTLSGAQVQIGGNDVYVALCRRHWIEAHADAGNLGPDLTPAIESASRMAAE